MAGRAQVFMKVSKQGSTLAGIMDAFGPCIGEPERSCSTGYRWPTFVRHFTQHAFEPPA